MLRTINLIINEKSTWLLSGELRVGESEMKDHAMVTCPSMYTKGMRAMFSPIFSLLLQRRMTPDAEIRKQMPANPLLAGIRDSRTIQFVGVEEK